jgi:hypothetical protein
MFDFDSLWAGTTRLIGRCTVEYAGSRSSTDDDFK